MTSSSAAYQVHIAEPLLFYLSIAQRNSVVERNGRSIWVDFRSLEQYSGRV